ncbi:UbiX family flavin prenyltransferase [Desulfosarcina sp. OttesenSCG-928-A07]|nr:UbiX family flavin prenyltransferase [Desulfosarcina sp. OttesenSCG-928-G17]MDL2328607.1 UbiX family flavin prenyltransferase [Desulfosarcina sp. OttesenSCG-928-A07]
MTPPSPSSKKRLVIGITGASGVIYGLETLKVLKHLGYETHVVLTRAAETTLRIETPHTRKTISDLATVLYDETDIAAPIASGSFQTAGMIVIPCSIKTLSAISHSFNANLLVRAADVTLKERRPLVLVVRETPLHQGHLSLMVTAAQLGATILPPVPAFYHQPQTILDLIHQSIGKVLDCFDIEHNLFRRWGESE